MRCQQANIIIIKYLIATKKATSTNFKFKKKNAPHKMKSLKWLINFFFKLKKKLFLNVLSNQTLQFRKIQNLTTTITTTTTATTTATLHQHLLSKRYQIQIQIMQWNATKKILKHYQTCFKKNRRLAFTKASPKQCAWTLNFKV